MIPKNYLYFVAILSNITQLLRKQIPISHRRLPIQIEEDNVLYVHASSDYTMQWKYISNARNAYSSLIEMEHSLCFIGHSHIPEIYAYNELLRNSNKATLSRDDKTMAKFEKTNLPLFLVERLARGV